MTEVVTLRTSGDLMANVRFTVQDAISHRKVSTGRRKITTADVPSAVAAWLRTP
jgi:hypothetical protein